MKIHTADDVTPYNYMVHATLQLNISEGTYESPHEYVNRIYPGLIQRVHDNKRPRDLCGRHKLFEDWNISVGNYVYSFSMHITGFGIEYTITELRDFFLNVFPEFTPVFNKSIDAEFTTAERIIEFTLKV